MTPGPKDDDWRRFARPAGFGLGLLATLWFLVRVIQKPNRATYPCMRASFPIMSAFLAYLVSLAGAAASVRLLRRDGVLRGLRATTLGALALTLAFTVFATPRCGRADETPRAGVLGQGVGIHPGRVVWMHDPAATNERCTNQPGDGYFLAQNNDQAVIDGLLSRGLMELTGAASASDACRQIFRDFNQRHGRGAVGYAAGERVFVKINATSSWGFGESWGNVNPDFTIVENSYYGTSETSPAAVLAMLRLLVHECGVPESAITVGDPMKEIYAHALAQWQPAFPSVIYLSAHGGLGRTQSEPSAQPLVFYSDRGQVLRSGTSGDPAAGDPVTADHLYSIYEQATYIINLAALKGHNRGGVTLCAKNHFGANTRGGASHLHMGLVRPAGQDSVLVRPDRQGYRLYRVLVDLMGHRLIGGKTLLYVIDGLWGGTEAVDPPVKFASAPFAGDWSSLLLLSQDPVAIDSVGYDILKEELSEARHPGKAFPQMSGVDDYLHQAADPHEWPAGITYDPENDGTSLASLGVHEHWNNAGERQYSRDRGASEGIELIYRRP